MKFPSVEIVNILKKNYPEGARVELVIMNDPNGIEEGTKGTVVGVDDVGTIHVNWDNGRRLGCAFGEDYCKVVSA